MMIIRPVSPSLAVLCCVVMPLSQWGNLDVISRTASWLGWRLLSDLWQEHYGESSFLSGERFQVKVVDLDLKIKKKKEVLDKE